LLALSKQKSPVKIEKFSVSKKYGREDIVINKRTIITPTVVSFDHVDLEETMEIKALKNVRPDQLVSVRGTIVELSGTKTVLLQGNNVKKQEAFLADPTGYVKVILWGSHTDNVEKDLTYNFNKLRVKMYQNQMYLNTPKQENQCVITQSEHFKEKLNSQC
jgi:ssDNA-binding replication factor A large subunit